MPLHQVSDSDAFLQDIRNSASAIIARTSLRQVAREIALSPTGLSNFLEGARPQPETLRRLRNWYEKRKEASASLQTAEALSAIGVLTEELPERRRPTGRAALVGVLTAIYEENRPGWVTNLIALDNL